MSRQVSRGRPPSPRFNQPVSRREVDGLLMLPRSRVPFNSDRAARSRQLVVPSDRRQTGLVRRAPAGGVAANAFMDLSGAHDGRPCRRSRYRYRLGGATAAMHDRALLDGRAPLVLKQHSRDVKQNSRDGRISPEAAVWTCAPARPQQARRGQALGRSHLGESERWERDAVASPVPVHAGQTTALPRATKREATGRGVSSALRAQGKVIDLCQGPADRRSVR
jgi:hypothetical protein